jgi:hypothetical protein
MPAWSCLMFSYYPRNPRLNFSLTTFRAYALIAGSDAGATSD